VIYMARDKNRDGGYIDSFYNYDEERRMIENLKKNTIFQNNKSDIIRAGIRMLYDKYCGDPLTKLQEEKSRVEERIKIQEGRMKEQNESATSILRKYMERKKHLTTQGFSNYEKVSKTWIENNIKEVSKAFPGKTVDEIYKEMESRCNGSSNG